MKRPSTSIISAADGSHDQNHEVYGCSQDKNQIKRLFVLARDWRFIGFNHLIEIFPGFIHNKNHFIFEQHHILSDAWMMEKTAYLL